MVFFTFVFSVFACPKCGRIYKWKQSLQLHRRLVCGREPKYRCDKCDYRAFQKIHLTRHRNKHHESLVPSQISIFERKIII